MASNTHCGRSFFYKLLQVAPVSHFTLRKLGRGRKEGMRKFKPTQINLLQKKKKFPHLCKKGGPVGIYYTEGNRRLANSQGRNHDSSKLSERAEWDGICLEFTFRPRNALWTGKLECLPWDCDNWLWSLGQNSWKSLGLSFLICRWSPRSPSSLMVFTWIPSFHSLKGTGPLGGAAEHSTPQTPEPQAQTQERC